MAEQQSAQWIVNRLSCSLHNARTSARINCYYDVDGHYPGQTGEPDRQRQTQLRIVRFPQDNQRQSLSKAVNRNDGDVADEEHDERAQRQKMQASCALPSVKDLDIPRETSGNGWGHRYSRRNAERREQEYDRCVT